MKNLNIFAVILAAFLSFAATSGFAGHCNTADGHTHDEDKEKTDKNY